MTPIAPQPQRQPYVPTSKDYATEDSETLKRTLTKDRIDVGQAINSRTIGTFEMTQLVTGERWFPDATKFSNAGQSSSVKRQTYRQVYEFTGPIAPGATVTITHNITGVNVTTTFTRIYGTAFVQATAAPTFDNRSIPYADAASHENIQIRVNATQITITNGDGTGTAILESGIVVLEYLLN